MKKKEWQKFHGFTDEEVRKFDVFVPPGRIISIENKEKFNNDKWLLERDKHLDKIVNKRT